MVSWYPLLNFIKLSARVKYDLWPCIGYSVRISPFHLLYISFGRASALSIYHWFQYPNLTYLHNSCQNSSTNHVPFRTRLITIATFPCYMTIVSIVTFLFCSIFCFLWNYSGSPLIKIYFYLSSIQPSLWLHFLQFITRNIPTIVFLPNNLISSL